MLTEFEIIRRYFSPATDHTVLAGGDDAALVAVTPAMELAVSTDTLVAGHHFFADAEPYGVGYKSLAASLSDLAAMGARPRWATLSLTLPAADERWLEQFAYGFLDLARAHEVDLIGGDTTRGPLAICVQIMGEMAPGKALRRSGAGAGDDLWASGTLGDAALALAHIRGEFDLHAQDRDYAIKRLNHPQPRVALGQGLVGLATAAIDISDGLAADVGHIAEASRARAVIEWQSVPLSPVAARYRQHPLVQQAALAGGDDYELAFTAPPSLRTALEVLSGQLGLPLTRIGRIEAGAGAIVLDESGRPLALAETGFDHFR
jgi:thiamine-monophosphate kinase